MLRSRSLTLSHTSDAFSHAPLNPQRTSPREKTCTDSPFRSQAQMVRIAAAPREPSSLAYAESPRNSESHARARLRRRWCRIGPRHDSPVKVSYDARSKARHLSYWRHRDARTSADIRCPDECDHDVETIPTEARGGVRSIPDRRVCEQPSRDSTPFYLSPPSPPREATLVYLFFPR